MPSAALLAPVASTLALAYSGQGGCPSAAAADGNGHACETRASGATASGAEADGDVDMGASPEVVVDDEGDVDMHT